MSTLYLGITVSSVSVTDAFYRAAVNLISALSYQLVQESVLQGGGEAAGDWGESHLE